MDEQAILVAALRQLAEVPREVLEPRVGRFHEDVGLVARLAQHALDPQDLVPMASP